MNTPSHFIMTAALGKACAARSFSRKALLWGSVAPDLPLYALSLGGMAYFTQVQGWSAKQAARHIFGSLYFENMWWIALHNLLHSPVVLLVLSWGVQHLSQRQRVLWGSFLGACALHSVVDILTHVNDGPVLFFPLNWDYRFRSAISYWDPRYYGREFSLFELAFNGVLGIYLLQGRLQALVQGVKRLGTRGKKAR